MDNPYKHIAPEDILRMQQEESMMEEIMPMLSPEELKQECVLALDGFDLEDIKKGAKAQIKADKKSVFLKLASYPRHYRAGIRYLHMPVEDWEAFKKDVFPLKEAIDG